MFLNRPTWFIQRSLSTFSDFGALTSALQKRHIPVSLWDEEPPRSAMKSRDLIVFDNREWMGTFKDPVSASYASFRWQKWFFKSLRPLPLTFTVLPYVQALCMALCLCPNIGLFFLPTQTMLWTALFFDGIFIVLLFRPLYLDMAIWIPLLAMLAWYWLS